MFIYLLFLYIYLIVSSIYFYLSYCWSPFSKGFFFFYHLIIQSIIYYPVNSVLSAVAYGHKKNTEIMVSCFFWSVVDHMWFDLTKL
jgi:hypothetical protein